MLALFGVLTLAARAMQLAGAPDISGAMERRPVVLCFVELS